MYDIFGDNIIKIVRGNSALIDITPIDTETGDPIILESSDKVLFTAKDRNGNTVIQKQLTSQDYSDPEDPSLNCIIDKEDTVDLLTGEYKYDCLYIYPDGQAITFISSTLIILDAVGTYKDILPSGGDSSE